MQDTSVLYVVTADSQDSGIWVLLGDDSNRGDVQELRVMGI